MAEYTQEQAERLSKILLGQSLLPKPIDWRKVAASLREGERAADTQIAKGLRHAEQIAAAAVVGMICHVLAAAIEDGLS